MATTAQIWFVAWVIHLEICVKWDAVIVLFFCHPVHPTARLVLSGWEHAESLHSWLSLCQCACWCVYIPLNWFDTLVLNCHSKALCLALFYIQVIIIHCHHRPGSHRARLSTLCTRTISTMSAHTLGWFSHGLCVLSNTAPYMISTVSWGWVITPSQLMHTLQSI